MCGVACFLMNQLVWQAASALEVVVIASQHHKVERRNKKRTLAHMDRAEVQEKTILTNDAKTQLGKLSDVCAAIGTYCMTRTLYSYYIVLMYIFSVSKCTIITADASRSGGQDTLAVGVMDSVSSFAVWAPPQVSLYWSFFTSLVAGRFLHRKRACTFWACACTVSACPTARLLTTCFCNELELKTCVRVAQE